MSRGVCQEIMRTKGLVHIYHGDGKGKTTAAFGLALRALGNGWRVGILQFLKGSPTGEVTALEEIKNVTVRRNSKDFGFFSNMSLRDRQEMTAMQNHNLQLLIEELKEGKYDMVILDELCAAYNQKSVERNLVKELLELTTGRIELIITGRNPHDDLLSYADYVTQMQQERHPFERGLTARQGIEY